MDTLLIDDSLALQEFLNQVAADHTHILFVDLEGNNLSRHGTLSLITIHDGTRNLTSLVDVTTLGHDAFDTAGADGRTLRNILESKTFTKVFFDIRNDSDALYALYGISVQGIEDLQLMELASRTFSKRCVNGLAKSIERDAMISPSERRHWQEVKKRGKRLFAPELGGTYSVFDQRPLAPEIKEYCVQDVKLMPQLRQLYRNKLCDGWWDKIQVETEARIRLSQSSSFHGQGRHMAVGPPEWLYWRPEGEQLARTFLEQTLPASPPVEQPKDDLKPSIPVLSHVDHSDNDAFMSSSKPAVEPSTVALAAAKRSNDDVLSTSSGSDEVYIAERFEEETDHIGIWDDEDSRDFTACDKEYGYCGHCDY